MRSAGRQAGVSLIGLLLGAAAVTVVAALAIRVTPSYVEYFAVKSALEQTVAEGRAQGAAGDFRSSFQRRVDAGYIHSISSADLDFQRDGGRNYVAASWSTKLPLVGNASLLLEFDVRVPR